MGLMEGARRHDEMDSLNSTINSIFLNRLEQKDYKQIIEFYENDEFDLVLFRIKKLGIKKSNFNDF